MILQSSLLKNDSRLIHGFTTRETGSSYEKIASELGMEENRIVTIKQVHSPQAHFLSVKDSPWPRDQREGDAIVTDQPGIVVGIRTADCVPILIADSQSGVVAAVHAGWRGLVGGIIENALERMVENGAKTTTMKVAIGAAICESCFEVGPEVVSQFRAKFGESFPVQPGKEGKGFVDLREGCRKVLTERGIPESNIEILFYCTACDQDRFFSYRKGDEKGRMLSFIGIR